MKIILPRIFISISIILINIILFAISPLFGKNPIPKNTSQIILVLTQNDTSFKGTLYRFNGNNQTSNWEKTENPIDVVIGRKGLAWGLGLHNQTNDLLPQKKEGDGKSPAGIFKLEQIFGFPPKNEIGNLKLPYIHVTELMECIDDVNSKYYNQIIQRDHADNVDWHSSEKMLDIGPIYKYGVVVSHNNHPIINGEGSCIFLHIWRGPSRPTIGCTAMNIEAMKSIIYWLDEKKNPLLVQLTESLYKKFKTSWGLPNISLPE